MAKRGQPTVHGNQLFIHMLGPAFSENEKAGFVLNKCIA